MPAYKDSKQGTWYASFYFENWQGVKQKKLKRGLPPRRTLWRGSGSSFFNRRQT